MLRCFYIYCSPFFRGEGVEVVLTQSIEAVWDMSPIISFSQDLRKGVTMLWISSNSYHTTLYERFNFSCCHILVIRITHRGAHLIERREKSHHLLLCREIRYLVPTDCSRSGLAWGSAGRATGDQNSKVMGSNPTLVTVFLCPWGGLFFFVGLTLRWHNSGISQHRNLPLKATEERAIEFGCWN